MKQFIAVFFVFISLSISAEAGKTEVDEIFKRIASNKTVKSEFIQKKYIKKLNRSLESKGTLLFDSLLGIAWKVETPFPSVTVITQESMFLVGASGEKKVLSTSNNVTFMRFSMTLQSIFLGQSDVIMNEFNVTFIRSNKHKWMIKLVPRDSSLKQVVSALEIAGDEYIEKFTIYEVNSDEIQYQFNDTSFPGELTFEEKLIFKS